MTTESLSPPSGQRASETTRTPGPLKRRTLAPGIYPDMPMDDYLLIDAINNGLLVEGRRSMAHARHKMTAEPEPASAAMMLGSSVHLLSLEPGLFGERVILGPINERTGECYGPSTKAWADYRDQNPGKLILSLDGMRAAKTMADAIRRHPVAGKYAALPGRVEVTMVWTDPETGLPCKGRIDKLIDGKPLGYDLKTTRDARTDAFSKAVYQLGYFMQTAWYRRGARILGLGDIDIDLVVVENEPPHCVRVGPMDQQSIIIGEERCMAVLRTIARCMESGRWPGYDGDDMTSFGLSEWDKKRLGGVVEEVSNGDEG